MGQLIRLEEHVRAAHPSYKFLQNASTMVMIDCGGVANYIGESERITEDIKKNQPIKNLFNNALYGEWIFFVLGGLRVANITDYSTGNPILLAIRKFCLSEKGCGGLSYIDVEMPIARNPYDNLIFKYDSRSISHALATRIGDSVNVSLPPMQESTVPRIQALVNKSLGGQSKLHKNQNY